MAQLFFNVSKRSRRVSFLQRPNFIVDHKFLKVKSPCFFTLQLIVNVYLYLELAVLYFLPESKFVVSHEIQTS